MSGEPASEKTLNILALSRALRAAPGLLAELQKRGDVRTADSTDEALAALKTVLFDLVVAPPTDLFPLARSEARQRAELIVERIGQGICIVDRQGALIWGNTHFRTYSESVQQAVREHCAALCAEFAVRHTPAVSPTSRRRTVRVGEEHVFDLTVAPLLVVKREVAEVVGLVRDVTATHRLQDKIDVIDAAGRELVGLDADAAAQMDVPDRLKLLEDKTIQFARDLMSFDHFSVRILDKKTNRLETVIASGLPEQANTQPLYASTEGNGISGYVAAAGHAVICPDVTQDPRYLPGLEQAGSSLTVPLRLHDQIVGVLDVESYERGAFTEDDRQFAEIFGRYIAIALNILKLLVVERSTTTGQLAADVTSELALPLNDIITEATNTIQDYVGQSDLRRRLQAIIANVDQVKRNLQALTQTPGVSGLVPESNQKDPFVDGRRILIAEDEDIIRETIADVLSKSGALSVMARDGREAAAMIDSQHFDLVISDIKMPHKNGYEVFDAAKRADPRCPVILITGFGYDPEHAIVRASKEGLAGVLFKPFKVEQLVEVVRQALAARS